MFQLNIILLIISLLIYTTIFTLYIEVNYISVVTSKIKTVILKREYKVLLPVLWGETMSIKKL